MSADSPVSILFDELGHPIGVIQDGVVYRMQVESKRKPSSVATRISVNASVSDVLLLAANTARLDAIIYNDSNSPLLVGLGTTTVTSTNYSINIAAQSNFVIPVDFVGEIHGIWTMATGIALITELT